ncbi:WD40 repeat-like protein [Mycena venus]|uniref:WD40 repeat-like protein n=1 Tax=Mycena venus TaxID=2733690 RepID=A0A8H7CCW7_9AGAR|nr:WD40 repeat-like protein [Mycena venus]
MEAVSYDNTLGAAFIGGIFASILYGVTCVQAFIFFNADRKQSAFLKLIVLTLWIFDTLHLIFVCYALYWYMVTNYTNPAVLVSLPWSISAGILLTPTSDTIVRSVFTYRVWILSGKNRLLTFPLALAVFLIQLDGLASGIKGFLSSTFGKLGEITWVLYAGFTLSVVADFAIAITLCYYLYRSRGGIKRTDSLITVLMMYTINIGLLTSVFQLACFITYAVMRNFVFLAMYFPISKLYVNSLFATLNARDSLQQRDNNNMSIPLSHRTTTLAFVSDSSQGATQNASTVTPLSVHVETRVHESESKRLSEMGDNPSDKWAKSLPV